MDKYKSSRKKKRRGLYGTKKPSQDLEVEGNTATTSAESQTSDNNNESGNYNTIKKDQQYSALSGGK